MGSPVYANAMEVSGKAMMGKSICAFPDVCFTPPLTPATPPGVPIPYPNTGMASDCTSGSSTVQVSGQEVMLNPDEPPQRMQCHLEQFQFSAHASREALIAYARKLSPKLFRSQPHGILGLLQSHACLEASGGGKVVRLVGAVGIGFNGNPNVRWGISSM